MSPDVTAAWIAAGVGIVTVIATVVAQMVGFSSTRTSTADQIKATQKATADTLDQQREQLSKTLEAQSDQLERTLTEQRTRTWNERFATAAEQLGSDKPPVRLAGVYAMAGLADDWEENRQTCVDVLCAYLRMPYDPDPGRDAPEQLAFQAMRQVRHTVIRVITAHLRNGAEVSWQGLFFDFNGVIFDGGDFRGAEFSGSFAVFDNAEFAGGTVRFNDAKFSGGEVYFSDAKFAGGTVSFKRAEFSGGTVSFRRIELSGAAIEFSGAKFLGGTVSFLDARFSGGTVRFRNAKFSGATVDFTDTQFPGGTVDFSDAGDWSFPPALPWTDTPPSGVMLPEGQEGRFR